MSFINSGTTVIVTTYLTNKGRNFLVSGSKSDTEITRYVLGDSDTDYNLTSQTIPNLLKSGEIPDITGGNISTIKSLPDNVDIKHKIMIKPTIKHIQ